MYSDPLIQIILTCITSLVLSIFVMPKVIVLGRSLRLFDKPGRRSSHQKEIPVVASRHQVKDPIAVPIAAPQI